MSCKYEKADGPGPSLAKYERVAPAVGPKAASPAAVEVSAKPVRITLAPPGSDDPYSVLVAVSVDEGVARTLVLAHEYPDVKPEPGWVVKGRGLSLVVAAVDGSVLTCI